jgi:hypothetical protein
MSYWPGWGSLEPVAGDDQEGDGEGVAVGAMSAGEVGISGTETEGDGEAVGVKLGDGLAVAGTGA